MRQIYLLSLWGLSFMVFHACQSPNSMDMPIAQIDSLFENYEHPDSPGFAIGIIQAGKLTFSKGYGSAN